MLACVCVSNCPVSNCPVGNCPVSNCPVGKYPLSNCRQFNYKDVISYLAGTGDAVNKTADELRKQKIKEHLDDLIENSSLHGLSYIFDTRHSIRRIIWFFITVIAFCYSMHKVYQSTVNYFDYPFNTARMRRYVNELEFPAVSFCNLNDMRLSVMKGTMVDAAILDHTLRETVTADEYRNVTRSAVHKLDEMLVECIFDGQKCSHKNFTEFDWMQGDRCFTFNSGGRGHNVLSVHGTGVHRSLMLTINVQHYDYYRDRSVSGIHLILHGHDETPVRIRGPMIPPGFTTYIQVEKKKVCTKYILCFILFLHAFIFCKHVLSLSKKLEEYVF